MILIENFILIDLRPYGIKVLIKNKEGISLEGQENDF